MLNSLEVTLTTAEARALLQQTFADVSDFREWEADMLAAPPESPSAKALVSAYRKCATVPGVWLSPQRQMKIQPLDR